MQLSDFKIGDSFSTASNKWYVLDRGQRTVVAISFDQRERAIEAGCMDWDEMLPYAIIFDPYDFGGCELIDFGT